jgi:hypothetical protein
MLPTAACPRDTCRFGATWPSRWCRARVRPSAVCSLVTPSQHASRSGMSASWPALRPRPRSPSTTPGFMPLRRRRLRRVAPARKLCAGARSVFELLSRLSAASSGQTTLPARWRGTSRAGWPSLGSHQLNIRASAGRRRSIQRTPSRRFRLGRMPYASDGPSSLSTVCGGTTESGGSSRSAQSLSWMLKAPYGIGSVCTPTSPKSAPHARSSGASVSVSRRRWRHAPVLWPRRIIAS